MAQPKILNVLYQSDNNYAMVTGVSIESLCMNNAHLDQINVYLLDDGISKENLARIKGITEKYGRKLIPVDPTSIRNMLIQLKVEPWRGTYTRTTSYSQPQRSIFPPTESSKLTATPSSTAPLTN